MDPRICDLAEVSLSSDGKPITASDTTVIQATPGTPIDITATIAANPARYTVGYVRVELLKAGYSVYPGEGTPTSGTLIADTLPTWIRSSPANLWKAPQWPGSRFPVLRR